MNPVPLQSRIIIMAIMNIASDLFLSYMIYFHLLPFYPYKEQMETIFKKRLKSSDYVSSYQCLETSEKLCYLDYLLFVFLQSFLVLNIEFIAGSAPLILELLLKLRFDIDSSTGALLQSLTGFL